MVKVKYSVLLFFITLLILLSCNSKSNGYTLIKGTLTNLDNKEIIITYFSSDSLVVDTILSDNQNKFTYKCSIDTLTTFSLYLNDQNASIMLFAEPNDKITIKGDAHITDLVRIHGNDINNDLTDFKEEYEDLLTKRNLLYNILTTPNDSKSAITATETDEQTSLNSINLQLILAAEEFIIKNPNRLSSLILINEFFANPDNSDIFERVMGELKPEILKTRMGLNLSTYLNKAKKSAEGVAMPYFKMTDVNGKSINSYDYKGKYLLLSFISSTGIESRETIKQLKNTYKNINKDSVEFISIYIDADLYPKEYIENDSIDWIVIPEKMSWASDIVDTYNIEFVPNNILISPSGVINSRNISATAVSKLLKNSTKNDL